MVCALSLPSTHHSWPGIVPYQMIKSEVDRLKEFIHKTDPEAEIFITPQGQEGRLKEYGWERVPWTWRGNQIWIQRKPATDHGKKLISTSA